MTGFWNLFGLMASAFFFMAYLLVLFQIVGDLFRDPGLGGFAKAVWIVGLIFLPVLTALVYLVTRGAGMAARHQEVVQRERSRAEAYIRDVAGRSPVDQIADATKLLDAGVINQDEFTRLKATALAECS